MIQYNFSRAAGADGITALNLVLPIYSLIFAIGSMIGVGAATRFRIATFRGEENRDRYFPHSQPMTIPPRSQ